MSALHSLVESQRRAMVAQYRQITESVRDVFSMTELLPPVIERVIEFNGVLVHMTELRVAILDDLHGSLE